MKQPLSLIHTTNGSPAIEAVDLPPLQDQQVRIRTLYTGVSHAEEVFFMKSNHQPGSRYPITWGSGVIEEIGSQVTGFQSGDCVAAPLYHQTHQHVDSKNIYPVKNLKPEFAIFLNSSMTALKVLHQAGLRYGDHAAVFGMGTVGLMMVQYALLSGATHLCAIDYNPDRLRTAQRLGAHCVSQPNDTQIEGKSFHNVFECSGSDDALIQGELLLVDKGRLGVCGYRYSRSVKQQVQLQCVERGILYAEDGVERHHGIEKRIIESLQKKHAIVWPIPYQIFPFQETPAAYAALLQKPNECIQLGLSYG